MLRQFLANLWSGIMATEYGSQEYWEERYTGLPEGEVYDWFHSYHFLKPHLSPYFTSSFEAKNDGESEKAQADKLEGEKEPRPSLSGSKTRFLNLGCGNSTFGEKMYLDGFPGEIINIDYSASVISFMNVRLEKLKATVCGGESKSEEKADKSTHNKLPGELSYLTMNATSLSFPSSHFDLVLDKGMIDAIMCGTEIEGVIDQLMSEVGRVLKKGGHFILISYGEAECRELVLKRAELKLVNQIILEKEEDDSGSGYKHFIYVLRK